MSDAAEESEASRLLGVAFRCVATVAAGAISGAALALHREKPGTAEFKSALLTQSSIAALTALSGLMAGDWAHHAYQHHTRRPYPRVHENHYEGTARRRSRERA